MGPQRSFPPRRKENTGLPESGSTGALRSMLLVVALAVIAFGFFVKSGQPPEMDGDQTEVVRLAERHDAASSQEETTLPDSDSDDDAEMESALLSEEEQRNAENLYELGMFYLTTPMADGEIQPHKSVFWLRKAAELGHVDAQTQLAVLYDAGVGVLKDKKEAFHWYNEAARQGDFVGLLGLGLMYKAGDGVSPDRKKAGAYFLEAARTLVDDKDSSREELCVAYAGLHLCKMTLAGGKPSAEAAALERELERRLTPEERAEGLRKAEKMLRERDRRAS